jgi:L-lactate dehydrogenase complex protein LldG
VSDRAAFLRRIRTEIGKTRGLFDARVSARPARPADAADTIRRELAERWPATLVRFRQEFERIGGSFHAVPSIGDVPRVIAGIARERESRRVVTWHPSTIGIDLGPGLMDDGLEVEAMPPGDMDAGGERSQLRWRIADADLGVTGADLAIAETGTLVLVSGRGRPRSTSLLPPYHVAIFDRGALVESLAQAGVFLEAWHGDGAPTWRGGAINFITGPSRTADIELTLTRGVHGPKEVHAIFVEADGDLAGGTADGRGD